MGHTTSMQRLKEFLVETNVLHMPDAPTRAHPLFKTDIWHLKPCRGERCGEVLTWTSYEGYSEEFKGQGGIVCLHSGHILKERRN